MHTKIGGRPDQIAFRRRFKLLIIVFLFWLLLVGSERDLILCDVVAARLYHRAGLQLVGHDLFGAACLFYFVAPTWSVNMAERAVSV